MKFFAAIAALVSVLPHIAAVGIDTPTNVVQCQPQSLTFNGEPPFYISIIPGGQPSASPIEQFPRQDGTSLTFVVDIASGTEVTFQAKDATGVTAYTDKVTIQKSNDSSCLHTSAPNSGGSTSVGGTSSIPQVPAPTASNRPGAANVPSQQTTAIVTTTVRPLGGIQAVSSSTSPPLPAATVASSGAKSLFTFGTFGLAAVAAFFSAFFL